jgi:hypothetical protein
MAWNKTFSITRASSIADLPAPVAVCCHDAGGANMVAAWVASDRLRDYKICAEGPALKIFAAAVPNRTAQPLSKSLDGASCLLSGSGWASRLEHEARTAARLRGIPVVAALDHWVNYRMRFTRDGAETLPDLLVVTDRQAANLAAATFGSACPVAIWENLYLKSEAAAVARHSTRVPAVPPARLLVLLEPIRQDWIVGAPDPAEFRALDYLMENMAALSPTPDEMVIRLRPHPSEPTSKYLPWLRRQNRKRLALSVGRSLSEDIAWADMAAGLESYALIVALESRRRAVSYLPPAAPLCSLQHPGLEHLDALINPAS